MIQNNFKKCRFCLASPFTRFDSPPTSSCGLFEGVGICEQANTIQQLKDNIWAEIRGLAPETLHLVVENALERAQICERENRGHLRDLFFIASCKIIP